MYPVDYFSVAQHIVSNIPRLFPRNERLVCEFKDERQQPFVSIMVGALNVSAMDTTWAGPIKPAWRSRRINHAKNLTIELEKGAEMGRFNLGSTVILLYPDNIEWNSELKEGTKLLMGEAIGRYTKD